MDDTQATIQAYLQERGWDHLAPADLAKSIMIEGAELLEHFQWKNHTAEEVGADHELQLQISHELADVMIYCIELAICLQLDARQIITDKLVRNMEKYPADKIHGAVLADKDSSYMQRKMSYRQHGQ